MYGKMKGGQNALLLGTVYLIYQKIAKAKEESLRRTILINSKRTIIKFTKSLNSRSLILIAFIFNLYREPP